MTDPRLSRWMAAIACSVALAGCATPIVPGQTTAAQVEQERGRPSMVWSDPDGGRTLVYTTQPMGTTCLMVKVAPDGKVVSATDALSDAGLARVRPGMTPEQVSRLLGPYRTVQYFPLSGETVWDWNVDNMSGPGTATRFNVHFKDGKVVRTSRTYEFPGELMDGPN